MNPPSPPQTGPPDRARAQCSSRSSGHRIYRDYNRLVEIHSHYTPNCLAMSLPPQLLRLKWAERVSDFSYTTMFSCCGRFHVAPPRAATMTTSPLRARGTRTSATYSMTLDLDASCLLNCARSLNDME